MRIVGVVTTSRADSAAYEPVLRRIRQSSELALALLVVGSSPAQSGESTLQAIAGEELTIQVGGSLPPDDTARGIVYAMADTTKTFGDLLLRWTPDILLVLGDRYEMHAAVSATVPFLIPVAHIHGGELSQGSIDDAFRHSITKLSHIHFASTAEYGRRIVQLGEEPWRVHVTGAPSLDNLLGMVPLSHRELSQRIGVPIDNRTLLVTYHPETLEANRGLHGARAMLNVLTDHSDSIVVTAPNLDPGHELIRKQLLEFCIGHSNAVFVENLGTQAYFSLMALAGAMVGNSSSGIIEAASFELPVVNIGMRQERRTRAKNVIDVEPSYAGIHQALVKALSPAFRNELVGLKNPYSLGGAAKRIVDCLEQVQIDRRLLSKRFFDISPDPLVDDC